jgi:transposase
MNIVASLRALSRRLADDHTARSVRDLIPKGKLEPDSKDKRRVQDMIDKLWYDKGLRGDAFDAAMERKCHQMARSIKDPAKAWRRAEAFTDVNYHDCAAIFYDRARALAGA